MKTFLKILCSVTFLFDLIYAKNILSMGNEVKEYDTIFEKIAEKRIGIQSSSIDAISNPFILNNSATIADDNNTPNTSYQLEATINQHAKINGNWYKIHQRVGEFKLVKVNPDSIILHNEAERKEIFIRTKDASNIKIFSK
ncbi:MAG: hypothetical protein PHR87_02950 [Sulfurospirillaceae bacterium]|nr:hypothetical protein [Sulfurospirillaceae bacterium]